ncbi:MAG TPA: hypothetical protein VFU90_11200, partial [Candidatus Tumulicola sp.]|nr:hypothetical protein [Candidatus Tumulicola sp.]
VEREHREHERDEQEPEPQIGCDPDHRSFTPPLTSKRKRDHYDTACVVVVSPEARAIRATQPTGSASCSVLTIGCSGVRAPAGYSPLHRMVHSSCRRVKL